MKTIKQFLSLAVIILTLTSCASLGLGKTGVTKTSSEIYQPTAPNSITIYSSTKPQKAFKEIGTVSVLRVKSPIMPIARPVENVKKEMQEKAASIGGNAIIDYRESGEANMTGTIIRFE